MTTKTLSRFKKLSSLATAAIADLRKAERSKKYVVNMNTWHEPINGVCNVCLAGAVMANRLGKLPRQNATPLGPDSDKLTSLDWLRCGLIHTALRMFHGDQSLDIPEGIPYTEVADYSTNRDEFYDDMRYVIKLLKKHGF